MQFRYIHHVRKPPYDPLILVTLIGEVTFGSFAHILNAMILCGHVISIDTREMPSGYIRELLKTAIIWG